MTVRDLKRRSDIGKANEANKMSIDQLTEVPCDLFNALMHAAEQAKARGQHTLVRDRFGAKKLQNTDPVAPCKEVGRRVAVKDANSGARALKVSAGQRPAVSLSAAAAGTQGSLPPAPKSPPTAASRATTASTAASSTASAQRRSSTQPAFPGIAQGMRSGTANLFGLRQTEQPFRFRAASAAAVDPCRWDSTPKMGSGMRTTMPVWRASAKSLLSHDMPRVRAS
jgi:hypothetical protein